ncbi:MAG TPA: tRNA glutamyl-Q(34) synthetase GluQRS [Isosphaeraceae bacterium]|jgi:glutamyl-tRNA synthetase|nr:tRNA glutamyl-Q(34) synthetase GluQRS [Isosphaeraceae bacterium]
MMPDLLAAQTRASRPVGRLAPSPTGGLHLGHARTFLIAWLAARSGGGKVIFRLEDIDASRVRPEAAQGALDDLRWLGLDWDEGPDVGGPSAPYVQSERLASYNAALDRLKAQELVYPCTCTRADIERAASAPHPGDEGPRYPGTCAGQSARDAQRLGDRPFAWRFRVPHGEVGWRDLVRGPEAIDPSRIGGDFVVGRSNGAPAYQLAVVADDAAMGVTQVIRGDDLISSTPRQLLLYDALGLKPPEFGHVPLAVNADGRRLAKRDQSIKLAALREAGLNPMRLVGWLAQSCGWTEELALSEPKTWIGRFDLARLPRDPWLADVAMMSS